MVHIDGKPRLTGRALQPVIAGLDVLGHPSTRVLADAGIEPRALADPDAPLPPGAMARVWDAAMAHTRDDHLGLHLAQAVPLAAFEVHAYAMLSSASLREAYHRVSRYQRLINEGTELAFTEENGRGVLRHRRTDGRAVPRQPAEFLAATWLRLGQQVAGTPWRPDRVLFAHERPADTREHFAILGAHLQFSSGQTALYVPSTVLDSRNARADNTLVSLLDRYAASLLGQRPSRDPSVSARVRAWLVEQHHAGPPVARQAARALAMSERTLHRHLARDNTTFRKLLDQFRHERAVALIASRRHSIAETAFLLGFAELSSFYRAFRRWTGRSPADLRDESARS